MVPYPQNLKNKNEKVIGFFYTSLFGVRQSKTCLLFCHIFAHLRCYFKTKPKRFLGSETLFVDVVILNFYWVQRPIRDPGFTSEK